MSEMSEDQRREMMEKLKHMSPEELHEFQKKQCIFCQISNGKIPAKKVYEDDRSFAVLDINPANRGHILLLPKEHYAIMPQIPDEEIEHLSIIAKRLSHSLLKSLKVEGTSIFIANGTAAGQRAQHFMIHIIPREPHDGLLKLQQKNADNKELEKIREALQNNVNKIFGIKKEVVVEHKEHHKEDNEESTRTEHHDKHEPKEEHHKKSHNNEPEEHEEDKHHETKHEEKHHKPESHKKESKEHKPKKKESKKSHSKEDVTLDDIASLFKHKNSGDEF